jgi:hypothetical protein
MRTEEIPDPENNKEGEPEIISGGGTPSEQTQYEELNFMLDNTGEPIEVRVKMHYPTYDVELAGNPVAQLEQDHHSNWFVTSGKLEDALVQEIGRRIVAYIVGE